MFNPRIAAKVFTPFLYAGCSFVGLVAVIATVTKMENLLRGFPASLQVVLMVIAVDAVGLILYGIGTMAVNEIEQNTRPRYWDHLRQSAVLYYFFFDAIWAKFRWFEPAPIVMMAGVVALLGIIVNAGYLAVATRSMQWRIGAAAAVAVLFPLAIMLFDRINLL